MAEEQCTRKIPRTTRSQRTRAGAQVPVNRCRMARTLSCLALFRSKVEGSIRPRCGSLDACLTASCPLATLTLDTRYVWRASTSLGVSAPSVQRDDIARPRGATHSVIVRSVARESMARAVRRVRLPPLTAPTVQRASTAVPQGEILPAHPSVKLDTTALLAPQATVVQESAARASTAPRGRQRRAALGTASRATIARRARALRRRIRAGGTQSTAHRGRPAQKTFRPVPTQLVVQAAPRGLAIRPVKRVTTVAEVCGASVLRVRMGIRLVSRHHPAVDSARRVRSVQLAARLPHRARVD